MYSPLHFQMIHAMVIPVLAMVLALVDHVPVNGRTVEVSANIKVIC